MLAQTPRRAQCKAEPASFSDTLEAAGDSAMFGTPDEIAAKLEALRAAGIEHILLNGPAGSRDNLRASRATSCRRSRATRERAAPRLVKR